MSRVSALTAIEIIATIAAACLLILTAISYMRAVNALSTYLKTENPEAWRSAVSWPLRTLRSFLSNPSKLTEEEGVSNLVLGILSLNIPDPHYGRLLWTARKWLIACLFLFMTGIIAIGWFSQNSR